MDKNRLRTQTFVIEELMEDSSGNLRPVKPEDLYMHNHPGVRAAFRMLYELMTAKDLESKLERISKETVGEGDKGLL